MQPEKFRNPEFLSELKELKADLQVVVAFKMLPEVVWDMPKIGTINLHASLLPHYRGAAPLNWVIINGEKRTGVTTFILKHEIDTGNIIFSEAVEIGDDETVGELHDKLMNVGSELLVKTVDAIESGDYTLISQDSLLNGQEPKHAPKIFKDDCMVDWTAKINDIYNLIRGLSPYPAAWSVFESESGENINLKIYRARKELSDTAKKTGSLLSDGKTYLKVAVKEGYIYIDELQLAGFTSRGPDVDAGDPFHPGPVVKQLHELLAEVARYSCDEDVLHYSTQVTLGNSRSTGLSTCTAGQPRVMTADTES